MSLKKLFTLLTLLFSLSITLSLSAFATVPDSSIVCYSNGNASIKYFPDENRYLVKNIDPQEIFSAFDNSPDFTPVDSGAVSTYSASSVNKTYTLTLNATGIYGELVPITFSTVVEIDYLNVGGVNYEYFLEIYLGPVPTLSSGSYKFVDGLLPPRAEILGSGSELMITYIVQLETTHTVSIETGVTIGWVNISGGTGTEGYFRSTPQTLTGSVILPIHEIFVP